MGQREDVERTSPKLFRLSELLEKVQSAAPLSDLPLLCQCVQKEGKGKQACIRALTKAKSLLGKSKDESFVFCCCHALKVIPFKISNDDAYLVHTRSVVADYVHLSEVAKLLKESIDYVKNVLWAPISPLDEAFAEETLGAVEQQAVKDDLSPEQMEMLSNQGKVVKELGRAYGNRFPQDHPAFDVVVYNMLKGSKLDRRGYEGLLKTTVAVKVKREQDSCIVRLIVKNLNLPDDKPSLPIVGLVFSGAGSPQLCLEKKMLKEFGKILLGKWENKKRGQDLSLSAPDGRWDASVAIHLNKEPDERLLKDIKLAHKVAIHMADNDIGAFLLEILQEEPERFKELLNAVTAPVIYSTESVERDILWFQILGDFLHILESSVSVGSLRLKHSVVESIFEVPERYSPLVPAVPVHDLAEEERRRLLCADIHDKGSRYKETVEVKLIPYGLELSDCDYDLMTHYLESYSESKRKSLVDGFALKVGKNADLDKKIWNSVARFCENKNRYDVLEKLYAKTLKGLPRIRYYFLTEAFGMLITGITAGIIPWYWVADKVGRKMARKMAENGPMQRTLTKASE